MVGEINIATTDQSFGLQSFPDILEPWAIVCLRDGELVPTNEESIDLFL